MEEVSSGEEENPDLIENIKSWSMKKKILVGVSFLIFIWILWSIFGGVNASTRAILELPQGTIEYKNGETTGTLDIRVGGADAKFSGVNPGVVKKNVLYSASEYPASAAFEIKNVKEPIKVALFDDSGNIITMEEVGINTEKSINPEEEYQYVLMADKDYFEKKNISPENNTKLLIDTLERNNG